MSWFEDLISKIFPNSYENNFESRKSFDEIYNDMGGFQYDIDGFCITYKEFSKKVKWDEITQLIAYKRDQITIDRIELEIVYGDKAFMISEDLPGWHQFVIKTKEVYPTIPIDWDVKIIQPAFETNMTTIYDKSKISED